MARVMEYRAQDNSHTPYESAGMIESGDLEKPAKMAEM